MRCMMITQAIDDFLMDVHIFFLQALPSDALKLNPIIKETSKWTTHNSAKQCPMLETLKTVSVSMLTISTSSMIDTTTWINGLLDQLINLLLNIIPVKYLVKEYYHMNMNEIPGEIFNHLNRKGDTIEELSKVYLFDNEELTHIAYQHEETHEFFCVLLEEEAEKEIN